MPADDKITFLVYTTKTVHVEPIPLEQAIIQGLIDIPRELLQNHELVDHAHVKLLNKPILKQMTLVDTPGIWGSVWTEGEQVMLLIKHATKILFLVNYLDAGVNPKASTRFA